jgi:ABC-type branched-subunit amino acid transport system substrate-binding protein
MKKFIILLSILVLVGVLGYGGAMAANPSKIKVGILLPLTGTFAAVAETQKEGALLAVDVVNKKGGCSRS